MKSNTQDSLTSCPICTIPRRPVSSATAPLNCYMSYSIESSLLQ